MNHCSQQIMVISWIFFKKSYFTEFLTRKNYPYTSAFQNQLIDIIGNSVHSKIIERCISSKIFSIIVDETTDISHAEQVSIVIRFVTVEYGKCMVEEHFIGFYRILVNSQHYWGSPFCTLERDFRCCWFVLLKHESPML